MAPRFLRRRKACASTRCIVALACVFAAVWAAATCFVQMNSMMSHYEEGPSHDQPVRPAATDAAAAGQSWRRSATSSAFAAALVIACFTLPLAPGSSMVASAAGEHADLRNGQRVFQQACSVCHTDGGNNLKPEKMPRTSHYDVEAIKYQVVNGKGAMPAFGSRLSTKDLSDVAHYVRLEGDKGWGH
eukprot:TRINITY_DN21950_c0_g1_i1.p1 TRINITY_DN21950_c0_g1~~TRINITY_DN21950_c0_g1_i1.p1  ORF type:complete len:208 (+),score=22.77 TRINITY_DN21950_c0_g1_i1:65-625(+)